MMTEDHSEAMHAHVLACAVIRVTVVTDGESRLEHVTCVCGKSIHVGTATPWTPRPIEQPGDQSCVWCHLPLPGDRHKNTRYHVACHKAREGQRLAERKRRAKAERVEA